MTGPEQGNDTALNETPDRSRDTWLKVLAMIFTLMSIGLIVWSFLPRNEIRHTRARIERMTDENKWSVLRYGVDFLIDLPLPDDGQFTTIVPYVVDIGFDFGDFREYIDAESIRLPQPEILNVRTQYGTNETALLLRDHGVSDDDLRRSFGTFGSDYAKQYVVDNGALEEAIEIADKGLRELFGDAKTIFLPQVHSPYAMTRIEMSRLPIWLEVSAESLRGWTVTEASELLPDGLTLSATNDQYGLRVQIGPLAHHDGQLEDFLDELGGHWGRAFDAKNAKREVWFELDRSSNTIWAHFMDQGTVYYVRADFPDADSFSNQVDKVLPFIYGLRLSSEKENPSVSPRDQLFGLTAQMWRGMDDQERTAELRSLLIRCKDWSLVNAETGRDLRSDLSSELIEDGVAARPNDFLHWTFFVSPLIAGPISAVLRWDDLVDPQTGVDWLRSVIERAGFQDEVMFVETIRVRRGLGGVIRQDYVVLAFGADGVSVHVVRSPRVGGESTVAAQGFVPYSGLDFGDSDFIDLPADGGLNLTLPRDNGTYSVESLGEDSWSYEFISGETFARFLQIVREASAEE